MSYVRTHVSDSLGALTIEQFAGGQSNPTYLLASDKKRLVLRKQPGGKLLPSAHAIDREYRIMKTLGEHGVPVPKMLHYCADPSVIGTPFYLMDHVAGRIFKDPLLVGMPAAERAAIHDAMNLALAKLHAVDYTAAGLADYGRAGNYFSRQIDRWSRQYRSTESGTIPAMEELMLRLPGLAPSDDCTRIVHGDFRIENLIYHPTEPRVLAILDWELSTLGHPLADLAYNCFVYRLPRRAFGGFAEENLAGSGIPSEREYVERYVQRSGIEPVAPWGFYIAMALFRLAAILQGVLQRAQQGHASSPDSLERGSFAPLCAQAGLAALEEAYA